MNTKNIIILLSVVILSLVGCTPTPTPTEIADQSGLPNPASVYCEEQGGQVEIRTDDGGQYGVCLFEDGSECEEWDFYEGKCAPEDAEAIGLPNPASAYCEEQGGQVEIRTDDEGGQYGMCIFEDGSECDEWAFFRGECKP